MCISSVSNGSQTEQGNTCLQDYGLMRMGTSTRIRSSSRQKIDIWNNLSYSETFNGYITGLQCFVNIITGQQLPSALGFFNNAGQSTLAGGRLPKWKTGVSQYPSPAASQPLANHPTDYEDTFLSLQTVKLMCWPFSHNSYGFTNLRAFPFDIRRGSGSISREWTSSSHHW